MPMRPASQFVHHDAYREWPPDECLTAGSGARQGTAGKAVARVQGTRLPIAVDPYRCRGTKGHGREGFWLVNRSTKIGVRFRSAPWRTADMKRLLMGTAALVVLGAAPAWAQQPVKIGFVS